MTKIALMDIINAETKTRLKRSISPGSFKTEKGKKREKEKKRSNLDTSQSATEDELGGQPSKCRKCSWTCETDLQSRTPPVWLLQYPLRCMHHGPSRRIAVDLLEAVEHAEPHR